MRHLTLPKGKLPSSIRPSAVGSKHIYYHVQNHEVAKSLCDWAISNNIEVWEHGNFEDMK